MAFVSIESSVPVGSGRSRAGAATSRLHPPPSTRSPSSDVLVMGTGWPWGWKPMCAGNEVAPVAMAGRVSLPHGDTGCCHPHRGIKVLTPSLAHVTSWA